MKRKTIVATTVMLVMTFAIFANSAVGMMFSPKEKLVREELTEITTFDEGVSGWKTFSLPFDSEISTDDIRVSHNGVLMNMQQAENQNLLYDDNIMVFSPADNCWQFVTDLEPGKAYIVYVLTSDDIVLSAVGAYRDGSGPITLQRGWNYFGLPTTEQIPVSGLRFSCEEKGIENLNIHRVHRLLVHKYQFWHLTNGDPYYGMIDLDNDVIVPGDGYLIYCYQNNVEVSFAPIFG